MLPRTFEEIARQSTDFQKRIESLEHQRSGSNRLIDSAILTAPVASVVFSNIPNIYDHLLILDYLRADFAAVNSTLIMRFNADAGANYDWIYAFISTGGVGTISGAASSFILIQAIEAALSPANTFSTGAIRINNYTNTSNHKSCIGDSSLKNANAGANIFRVLNTGEWRSMAAINSIAFFPGTGGNFIAGSRFDLYGIQGGE